MRRVGTVSSRWSTISDEGLEVNRTRARPARGIQEGRARIQARSVDVCVTHCGKGAYSGKAHRPH